MIETSITPAYVAGFFDGEGTIGIGTTGGKAHTLHVSISQKLPNILESICKVYGGKVTLTKRGYNILRLTGHTARKLLLDILPFTISKRNAIRLALTFIYAMEVRSKKTTRLSPRELELREQIKNEITACNYQFRQSADRVMELNRLEAIDG